MNTFFLLLSLFMSNALVADSNVKVSKDCRNWKIGENKDFEQPGYLQSEESDIVYFDFSKNLWIQMGKKDTLAFFEHNGNGLTIVDPSYANNAGRAFIDSFFLDCSSRKSMAKLF